MNGLGTEGTAGCIHKTKLHQHHSGMADCTLLDRTVGGIYCLQGRSTICLPLRVSRNEPARQVQTEVLQRFEYDAKMMMSGVIAKGNSSKTERAQVLIKGAPYEVSQLVQPDTLPQDWGQVCRHSQAPTYCVILDMISMHVLLNIVG